MQQRGVWVLVMDERRLYDTCTGLHGRYPEWVDPVNGTHHRYMLTFNLQQKNASMTLQGMQRAVQLLGAIMRGWEYVLLAIMCAVFGG